MKKFLLSLGILICCAGASRAQVEYPDVPLEDSAYDDLYSLVQCGVVSAYEYRAESGRGMTRYEFAVVVARLLEHIKAKTTNQENLMLSNVSPEEVVTIRRLANKFLPELKELGINVEQIKINGALLIEPKIKPVKTKVAPQFSDVPKNHWAFDAVEKLRLSGIVIGVSSGKTSQLNSPVSPNAPAPRAASGRGSVRR